MKLVTVVVKTVRVFIGLPILFSGQLLVMLGCYTIGSPTCNEMYLRNLDRYRSS